jgi:predicted amidophosphoribosyltransferase
MKSPNDVPLWEQLTAINLITSLRSEVCPGCGQLKARAKTFCPRCWRALPKDTALHLYRGIENGYAEAVLAALKRLGAVRFILPGDQHALKIGQVMVREAALSIPILRLSLNSQVCPKCAGEKFPGTTFCNGCQSTLEQLISEICVKRNLLPTLRDAEIAAVLDPIKPDQLTQRPHAYRAGMFQAMRLMRARVLHYPKET